MNTHPRSVTCDPDRLESFLSGDLTVAEEREFTLHLNTCESCRRSLERQAAEPEDWREAEELLQPPPYETPDDISPSGTTRPFAKHPAQIQSVLETLGPTDDPQMLGRIGGYEVSGVVGSGGMGVVVKAVDKSLDRTVAIKVLAPHLATSGAARKRFAREAKAAAAILHPNVIAIHSVSNDAALPYLVMPYVRGISLQKRLDTEGPLALHEILRIGSQIAAGLAAAHAQGLVHRDIKPANILLEEGVERVTITDFGLARAVDDATITHSGVIAGTPQYMSPEQARGESVEQSSDLFSLGSVLYACCTGRPPFRAETTYGVIRRIIDDEPKPIRDLNPEIPEWLCSIIGRLMSKKPASRFESAAAIAELLEQCLAHVQQPHVVPLPAALSQPPSKHDWRSVLLHRQGILTLAGIVAIGVLGVALLATEPGEIAGEWSGEGWGRVVLNKKSDVEYVGTYSETQGKVSGEIRLMWSRLERRFNGTWHEGDDRFGDLSVRLVGDELRGARTSDPKSKTDPAVPKLAELSWIRGSAEKAALAAKSTGDGKLLIVAVAKFNEMAAQHPIGKDQPPLTDDEVLNSLRTLTDEEKHERLTTKDIEQLRSSATERLLPKGWQFDVVTELAGVDGERFQVWLIQLSATRPDGTKAVRVIRERLLGQLDPDGKLLALPGVGKSPDDDATPLAAAINGFNASHQSAAGVRQPPLTEEEVVAAIRLWKVRRNEAPVSNREFAAFQKIAETRQLPGNAHLEVISEFGDGNGNSRFVWSVRIVMRRESMQATYAYGIREQFIRPEKTRARSPEDPTIAWGDVGASGLQVGVRVEPRNELYARGQKVLPIFCYRNAGRQKLDTSFPRLMTHSCYNRIIAVDATGSDIPIDQDRGPAGPVGWLSNSLAPGESFEVRGLPIVLGDVERGAAETAVRAKAGQSIRLRFDLPDLSQKNGKPLQTGELPLALDVKPERPEPQQRATDELRPGADGRQNGTGAAPAAAEPRNWPARRIGSDGSVKLVATSADGKVIAVAISAPMFPANPVGKRSVTILDNETGGAIASPELATNDEEALLAAVDGVPHFEVEAVALSPDGKVLAVGTGLGQVKLFDALTGELIRSLDDERGKLAEKTSPEKLKSLPRALGSVAGLAFSPDGARLAVCGGSFDDEGRNWGGIEGRRLLTTGPGRLKVWEVKTGKLLHDLAGHSHASAVAFSGDGSLLASAGQWHGGTDHGTGVIIWNPETGARMRTLVQQANGGTLAVAFSPTNKLVAIGSLHFDKENDTSSMTITLTYALSGITEWQRKLPGWAHPITFAPDGKSIAVLSRGQSILFLETSTAKTLNELRTTDSADKGRWTDLAIPPHSGNLVIGGVDQNGKGSVQVRDLQAPTLENVPLK